MIFSEEKEGNSLIRLTKRYNCNKLFDASLTAANLALVFDGATACTVNLLDRVPRWVNLLSRWPGTTTKNGTARATPMG